MRKRQEQGHCYSEMMNEPSVSAQPIWGSPSHRCCRIPKHYAHIFYMRNNPANLCVQFYMFTSSERLTRRSAKTHSAAQLEPIKCQNETRRQNSGSKTRVPPPTHKQQTYCVREWRQRGHDIAPRCRNALLVMRRNKAKGGNNAAPGGRTLRPPPSTAAPRGAAAPPASPEPPTFQ